MESINLELLPVMRKTPSIIYFNSYTCPHCVTARPRVDAFFQAFKSAQSRGVLNTDISMVAFNVAEDPNGEHTQDIEYIPRLVLHLPSQKEPMVVDLNKKPEEFVKHVAENSEDYLPVPTAKIAQFMNEQFVV